MGNKQQGQGQGQGQSQGHENSVNSSSQNNILEKNENQNNDSTEVTNEIEEEINERNLEIKFLPELGGGKGWPPDANVVLYHHTTGLILAGTECGTLYAYGDGFQYMQPAIVQMDITHILSLHEEKILVCFADNSMAVFQLPSLQLLYRIESSWLNSVCGDVTTIHIDENRAKYYVYVGTSGGYVRVLHIANEFREVEYFITTTDSGITGNMAVSDLQLSPKDEKYLIIAYDSIDTFPGEGAVVIFDLSKKKSYRTYKMNSGVTTLTCNHTGDMLFAGTRLGEVIQLGIDKPSTTTVWNSKTELVEGTDEDEYVTIRKMTWMFPQTPGSDGCLFVLLGSFGTDTDNLRSVIVALAMNNTGNLKSIFNIPPLQSSAEVVGFRLVSTWDKRSHDKGPVPGLLLLTQKSTEDRESVRELMVIRCPVGDISTWELELGMLPDPRPAMEVLPGKSPVTCVAGCIPGVPIGNFLINLEKGKSSREIRMPSESNEDRSPSPLPLAKGKSRRVSARDFFDEINVALTNFDDLANQANTWEMVLASGASGDNEKMDVLFVGQEDGSLLAWGVSLPPQNSGDSARSNCWVPLTALRCGTTEVTSITVNGKYLACGDESGKVVVWNCEDENAQALVQCFSAEVGQSVSSLYIDADGLFLVVGTQSGQIWTLTDWNAQGLQAVEGLRHLPGLSGPISYIFYAPYWKETSYEQAVYVLYSCGYVVVLNAFTREIRAYSGLIKPEDTTEEGDEQDKIIFGFVVSTKFEQITKVTEEMQQSILNFTPPSDSSQQPVESKSFMKKLKRGSGEVITLPPMKIPPNGPRYLLFVKGKYLIRCDLSKFARPISSSISSSSSSSSSLTTFSSTSNVLIQVSQISTSNIITCQLLSYIEDATRFWSKPILSISFLDEMSDMYFLTPKSCFQLNRHDSLPNVLTDPYNITNAIILSNGCTYICSNKNIIYSVNPYNPEYLLSDIPPSRSEMSSIPPDVSQQLLQKEVIDSTIKTKSKRRSSFLTLPSSGIDLDKLFIKTFDMKQKEEIFNRRSIKLSSSGVGGGESKEEYTIKSDNVKDNTTSALRTKAILDETRQNFEERGERIKILNKRAEEFNVEAAKYKAISSAHKEKMKQKAQRWGVF